MPYTGSNVTQHQHQLSYRRTRVVTLRKMKYPGRRENNFPLCLGFPLLYCEAPFWAACYATKIKNVFVFLEIFEEIRCQKVQKANTKTEKRARKSCVPFVDPNGVTSNLRSCLRVCFMQTSGHQKCHRRQPALQVCGGGRFYAHFFFWSPPPLGERRKPVIEDIPPPLFPRRAPT